MNQALHRFTRTKVLASSREASRPYPWVCPLCGVRVHHVREFTRYNGSYVSARFDHEANSARARSCDWFRLGSENGSHGAGRGSSPITSRSAPHLMARVTRDKWDLGIFMPRFEGDHGTFDFGDASPTIAPYDLSSVPAAGEVYNVHAQDEPYSVEIRAAGSAPMRIPIGTIGDFSLFAGSIGWGRLLGDEEMLAWNKSYLALGPKLPAAFFERVRTRILPRQKGSAFEAILFRLPTGPDAAIADAAKAALGREIRIEDLAATVVAPVTAHCGPDRTWLVPHAGDGLVIAYTLGKPTRVPTSVHLLTQESNAPESHVMLPAGTTQGLLQFPAVAFGYCEIRFDAAPAFRLAINSVPAADHERRVPWPTFAFGLEINGSIQAFPLWRADIGELLGQVRAKAAQLVDVRAPAGISVLVQVDSGGQIERRTFLFAETLGEQEFTALEHSLAEEVRSGLVSGRGMLIDAGGFGRVQLSGARRSPTPKASLGASGRSRWLDLVSRAHGLPEGASGKLAPALRRFRAHFQVEKQLP